MMSYTKVLELLLTLAFLLRRPAAARFSDCDAYDCFTNATYRSESLSVLQINTLLESLSTNIDDDGFYSTSVEDGQINGLALCRGDIELSYCRNCLREIGRQIKDECPRAVQAIRWSELCMLRYSNESISGRAAEAPVKHLWSDQNITRNPDRFKEARAELIDELRHLAVTGDRRSAFGNRSLPDGDNRTVYGMAQCTQDLAAEECDGCLANAAREILGCCDNTMGARIYMPSCILRYESDPFSNVVRKGKGKAKSTVRNIAIAVISSVASIILIVVCIAMLLRKRRKPKPKQVDPIESEVADDDQIDTTESIQYEFEKIRVATNDFSLDNKLGQGGFGVVYKGKLSNGQQIAVKRLSKNSGQGDEEFKNEVALVAKLQHRNLVRMLGFSQQGNEKLLIYEFVANGSLDCFIFDRIKRLELDYNKRLEIIRGIVKGILYLHEDSRLRIIHRDLKASNVLLDEDMNPKISDFGMARLVGEDGTLDNTNRIVGTYGYMAPEYANHGQFSIKSDTFSFGVVVLEIITGMKRIFRDSDDNLEHLSTYVWRNWCEGMATNIIDSPTKMSGETRHIVLRCIHIALLCVQENANNRPTMASVMLLLNSVSLPLPMPFPPAFSTPAQSPEASQTHSSSITTLYPR